MTKNIYLLLIVIIAFGCNEKNPDAIQKAYVTLQGQDKIAVLDLNAGEILNYIDVDFTNTGDMPHYIVIDESHNAWYCTLISSGYVLKFDLETDELVDSVQIGNMPALMALDEINEYLYISRFMPTMGLSTSSQLIHKIDTQTMDVIGTVNVGADSPHGIALSSDGETLWTASNQASHFFKIETNKFSELDYQPENFRIGSDVPSSYEINDGFYNALELELINDDSKLYVSCSGKMEIRVFDTETGDSLNTITTGLMPWHFKLSMDGGKLFAVNRMANTVTVYDMDTNEANTLTESSMDLLHGCALSGDGDLLVVTSTGSGYVYIYDTDSETLLYSIELGDASETDPMPTGVAIVH